MTKKRLVIIAFTLVVLVAAFLLFKFLNNNDTAESFNSQLTGLEVDADVAERPILAVVFDNHTSARPQTGLGSAGIVFEVVTEGGITRNLAFYQENIPEEVGPIRSLRSFFVDWVMGFDASVAHVGGSVDALQLVDSRNTKSLSQFSYSEPYYRSNERRAPHNMYAITESLRQLQDRLEHGSSQFSSIPRSDDQPAENPTATTINIDFSGPQYQVEFRYNAENNNYQRYLAGEPHIDVATNEVISVKNVVVVRLPANNAPADDGEGEAYVFKDGSIQTVRWQKDSYDNRIMLLNNEGEEVALNRGSTWFAVLPVDRDVTY